MLELRKLKLCAACPCSAKAVREKMPAANGRDSRTVGAAGGVGGAVLAGRLQCQLLIGLAGQSAHSLHCLTSLEAMVEVTGFKAGKGRHQALREGEGEVEAAGVMSGQSS